MKGKKAGTIEKGQKEITGWLLNTDLIDVLEGSFDGILVTDKDTKVLYVNDSYERIAEIRKTDLMGHRMIDLINPDWMPISVTQVVAEQRSTVSMRQVVKSGRHIMVTGRPVFDEDDEIKLIIVNVRDITEIYDLTQELQQSKLTQQMYSAAIDEIASRENGSSPIIAVSSSMNSVLNLAKRVADFQTTVLITGESGVGKEEVAKYIHANSARKDQTFITINCGAIPDNLLESELFGYEKGAFTGAMQSGKKGLLEAANHGTVFLDEIGETPLDFQVKLLRFLETKEVRRVGSVNSKNIDVRVLAATNRDLKKMVEEGTFREDLFFRLNVVQINVPPLRERTDDILPLAVFFISKYNQLYGQEKILTREVAYELEHNNWQGNVRELKNVIENMVIVSSNEYLQVGDLPWEISDRDRRNSGNTAASRIAGRDLTLAEATEELERIILSRYLDQGMSTRTMAERLGVNQSTIVRKLQRYRLR